MKQLARISWGVILAVAVAWPLAWLLVAIVGVMWALRETATSGSGGVAFIGFGITTGGMLLVIVPPVILVVLRVAASHVRPN